MASQRPSQQQRMEPPVSHSQVVFPKPPTSKPAIPSTSAVPFWTACPLPFSPYAYPQVIIPQDPPTPVGPGSLKPVLQVDASSAYQITEEKPKRAKRRNVKCGRLRDNGGKFVSSSELARRVNELETKLRASDTEKAILNEELKRTQEELVQLQTSFNDDMHVRQKQHAQMGARTSLEMVPPQDEEQVDIYSPFRHGNTMINAFKQKEDYTERMGKLKNVSAPHKTWTTTYGYQEYLMRMAEQHISAQQQMGSPAALHHAAAMAAAAAAAAAAAHYRYREMEMEMTNNTNPSISSMPSSCMTSPASSACSPMQTPYTPMDETPPATPAGGQGEEKREVIASEFLNWEDIPFDDEPIFDI